MDILKIIILSFSSFIFLFILAKLMGNREMAQLNMFDYIISITIGSIAAEMSTALESHFSQPLIAMAIYALGSIIVSLISTHSIKSRRFISGTTLILYDKGNIYFKNLKKSKIDLNEFLMQCRTNGYFNLSDLQTVILESNGKLSFIPVALKRPATPEDLNLNPKQDYLVTNVIIDGKILNENLKNTGNNVNWLDSNIKMQKIDNIKDIFLATCDNENNLSIYKKFKTLENQHSKLE